MKKGTGKFIDVFGLIRRRKFERLFKFACLAFLIFATGFYFFVEFRHVDAEIVGSSSSFVFSPNDRPEFVIDTHGLITAESNTSATGSLEAKQGRISSKIYSLNSNSQIETEIISNTKTSTKFAIRATQNNDFKPGRYKLSAELVSTEGTKILEQDFSWGVLAINFDRSSYRPNQNIYAQFAVLDDKGKTICDADLSFEVKKGNRTYYSTSNALGGIKNSDQCSEVSVTNTPDYYSNFSISQTGTYELILNAKTENGLRKMSRVFRVENASDFTIVRESASRIYPPSDYEMNFKVESNIDFFGNVREEIPQEFSIVEARANNNIKNGGLTDQGKQYYVYTENSRKYLEFPNIKIPSGEFLQVSYRYKAPNISPQFYLIGRTELIETNPESNINDVLNTNFKIDPALSIEDRNISVVSGSVYEVKTRLKVNEEYKGLAVDAMPDGVEVLDEQIDKINKVVNSDGTVTVSKNAPVIGDANNQMEVEDNIAKPDENISPNSNQNPPLAQNNDPNNNPVSGDEASQQVSPVDENANPLVDNNVKVNDQPLISEDITVLEAEQSEIIRQMSDSSPLNDPNNLHTISDGKIKKIIWQVEWQKDQSYNIIYRIDISRLPFNKIKGNLFFVTTDLPLEQINLDEGLWQDSASLIAANAYSEEIIFTESDYWQIAADATTSAKYPGTTANDTGVGSIAWTNTGNVTADDTNWATCSLNDNQISNYIKTTNFGFSASDVPSGSTINGITATINRKASSGSRLKDYAVQIIKGGAIDTTQNKADTTNFWTTGDNIGSYGGAADLWGISWSQSDIVSTGFGLAFSGNKPVTNTAGYTASVDYMTLAVTYTPPMTIAGTSNGSGTVKLAVNGSLNSATASISGGNFTLTPSGTVANNDVITVWIDSAADGSESTAVTKYAGSGNIGGMVLNTNILTIGSDQNTSLTVANLDQYDCSQNEDIMHQAASSALLVEGDNCAGSTANVYSSEKIDILSGDTLSISGTETLTTYDIDFAGTLSSGGDSTYNISGSWNNSGTFTVSTSTVNINGSTAQTVTTNSQSFNNFTVNNTGSDGANDNITISGTLDVNGTFNITNGDLVLSTNNPNITSALSLTIGSSAFVTKGTGTWTFDNGTTSTWTDNTASGQDLGSVIIDGSTKTINLGSSVRATTVTVGADDTFGLGSSGYTLYITGSGTASSRPLLLNTGATLNEGTNSTIKFLGTSNTEIQSESYNNVEIAPASGSPNYDLGLATSDSNGTAYKVDDSSNFGALPGEGKQLVRTSGNDLYAILNDGTYVEVWKSSDGSSWSQQNAAAAPSGDAADGVAAAIDGNDDIHIAYSAGTDLYYVKFATSTDTYGTPESIYSTTTASIHDIAVDSQNIPHVVLYHATNKNYLVYTNRISGSWKTPVQISLDNVNAWISCSITINAGDLPVIADILTADTNLNVWLGNDNNATSFTEANPDTSIAQTATAADVAFDASGNTWVSYVDDTTNYATLAKHTAGQAWTSGWSTTSNNNVGSRPSVAIAGTNIYMFYEDDNDDIVYDVYNGASWAGETSLATGTYQDVKTKWSYNFNNGGNTRIGYLYSDNTDVYWNNLILGADAAGTFLANNLTIGDGSNAVTVSANTHDPTLDINGNLTIQSSATFTASATATLSIGGNWSNAGTFNHSSSTIDFDASSGSKTIDSGGTGSGKVFNNLHFENASGGWTFQNNDIKIVGNLTIVLASSWTLDSGRTLEIDGIYTIAASETSHTTWTGSTLYLNSGTPYTVGSKTQNAETYGTLQIGANTDVRMWQSSAASVSVDSTGSLVSQDHAGTNGDIYLWGDYHISGYANWSYATDFDGTSLSGGSERQVDVRIDPSAKISIESGASLNAVGISGNRSSVSRQGASNGYEISCLSGGTLNLTYTDFDYLDGALGLDIQVGSIVTSLDYTDFDNLVGTAGSADAFITVATSVIGSASKTITGVNFDNTGSGAEFNVNRTGSDDTGYWDFDASTGSFDGENYDGSGGSNEASPGMLKWDDSVTTITVSGTVYTTEDKLSNIGANKTLALSVNGGAATTVETTTGGIFEFTSVVMVADYTVAVYISGETETGSFITQAQDAVTSITGIEMYTGNIVVSHLTAGPMTNLLLATADNVSDSDLLVSVDGSNIATFASNNTLWIESGKTYTPGAEVVTGGVNIDGTYNPLSNNMTIHGSWDANGGSVDTSGTITFDSPSGTISIGSNGLSFTNIVLDDGGGGATFRITTALDVNGTFTITNGTLDLDYSDPTVNIAGNITISAGAITKSSANSLVTFDGDLTYSDSAGVNFGDVQIGTSPDTTELSSDFICDSLTIAAGDRVNTNGYDIDSAGAITINSTGILDATDDVAGDGSLINLGGNWANSGSFTKDTSTVTLDGTGSQSIASNSSAFNTVVIANSSAEVYTSDASDITTLNINSNTIFDINGQNSTIGTLSNNGIFRLQGGETTVTITNKDTDSGTVEYDGTGSYTGFKYGNDYFNLKISGTGSSHTLNAILNTKGSFTITDGTVSTSGTNYAVNIGESTTTNGAYSQSGGTFTANGSAIVCYGNFAVTGGTFNANTSTLTLDATASDLALNTNSYSLNNVVFKSDSSAAARIVTLGSGASQTLTFAGYFYLNAANTQNLDVTADTYNPDINITGVLDYTGGGSGSEKLWYGDGTWTLANTINVTGGGGVDVGNSLFKMTNTGNIAALGVTFYDLEITSGTRNITPNSINTSNNLLVKNGATLTGSIGLSGATYATIEDGGAFTSGSLTLSNGPTLSATGTIGADVTYFDYSADGVMTARTYGGNVSIVGGYAYKCVMESGTHTIDGNLEIRNYTASSTITLDASTYDPTVTLAGNISFNSSAGSEILLAGDGTWSVGGNIDFTYGTFTANSGKFILNGTSTQTLSGTMTGASAFYDLEITNSSGADASDDERTDFVPSVDFAAAADSTGTFTITTASVRVEWNSGSTYALNNINWNGQASGTKIFFRNSEAANTWLLKVTGTQTAVSYVNVSRSDASVSGGSQIDADDGTNYDGNYNTNWLFPPPGISISGTADGNEGATVKIAVNSSEQTGKTATISSGNFTINDVAKPSVGAIITIWIDSVDDQYESTCIAKYNGADPTVSGMVLNTNVLSIGSSEDQSLILSDLDDWTNSNSEDVMHTVTGSGAILNVDGAGSYSTEKIDILGGDTLTINGTETLNTHHLSITGTLTSSGNSTYNVAGDWQNNSAVFTPSTSTVTMNGSGSQSITSATQAFSTLTISNTSAEVAQIDASTITTLNINTNASYDINGQNITLTTLSNDGTFKLHGDEASFTITNKDTNSGTIEYDGTGSYASLLYGTAYYSLKMSGTGTYTIATTTTCAGNTMISGSTVNLGNNTVTLTTTGAFNISSGAFTIADQGSYRTKNTAGSFSQSGGTYTSGQFAHTDINGDYSVSNGTYVHSAYSYLYVSGNYSISGGTYTQSGYGRLYFDGNTDSAVNNAPSSFEVASYINKGASYTLTLNTDIIVAGYTISAGNINTNNHTITANTDASSLNFNGQTIDNLVSTANPAYITGAVNISDSLSVGSGKAFTLNAAAATMTIQSTCSVTLGGSLGASNINPGQYIIIDDAVTNFPTGGTFNGKIQLQANTKDITIPARTYGGKLEILNSSSSDRIATLGTAGGQTITIGGTTYDTQYDAGLFVIANGTGNMTLDAAQYDPNITTTTALATQTTGDLDFTGTGGGTEIINAGDGTWSIKGDINFTAGTFNKDSSTFVLTGSGASQMQTITSASQQFNNLTSQNDATNGVRLADALSVGGNLYISAGSTANAVLDAATNNVAVTIGGNLDFTGAGSGSESILMGNNAWNVTGDWDTRDGSQDMDDSTTTVTGNYYFGDGVTCDTSSVILNGTSKSITFATIETFYDFSVSGSYSSTSGNMYVSHTLDVSGTLTWNSSNTSIGINTGGTLVLSGTITGGGILLIFENVTVPTGGTIDIDTKYSMSANGSFTFQSRTYKQDLTINNPHPGDNTYSASTGTLIVEGNFAISASSTGNMSLNFSTNDPLITIFGNADYTGVGAGSEDITAGTNDINIGGNIDFSDGAFTASTSDVILNGSAAQSITSNSQSFYDLTVTNASASGVIFADSSTITGTFTDITASSKLTFDALSTYTFANINLNGQASGTKIVMVSNDPSNPDLPSRQWYFNVAQSSPSASYVDVTDSDANGGNAINPIGSTNGGNNENWLFNQPPNSPTSLTQKKVTGGATLNTGDWTNENQVEFTATADDPDSSDTLYLCVEADPIATALSSTNGGDLCGTGVAYTGTPVSLSVTLTGLGDATEYHWQAQVKDASSAYSSYQDYGSNTENPPTNPAGRDFGVDTTAPTGGTVNDGTVGDQDWNDGTLNSISANWSGFDGAVSGINKYEYAVRRSSDDWYWDVSGSAWQSGESWVDNSTTTSATVNPIYLNTGEHYYFSVKATDNAGNTASAVDSNGQQVSPTLSFSFDSNIINFSNLNSSNDWTDTKSTTFTTSTNASNGYTIKGYIIQLLTSLAYPSITVPNFSYLSASWSSPQSWPLGEYGFGYTSSDTSVAGSNRFEGGTKYAPFSASSPGDVVADHTDVINGQTGAVTNQQFNLTYKVSVSNFQGSSDYQTSAIYVVTANY